MLFLSLFLFSLKFYSIVLFLWNVVAILIFFFLKNADNNNFINLKTNLKVSKWI